MGSIFHVNRVEFSSQMKNIVSRKLSGNEPAVVDGGREDTSSCRKIILIYILFSRE